MDEEDVEKHDVADEDAEEVKVKVEGKVAVNVEVKQLLLLVVV